MAGKPTVKRGGDRSTSLSGKKARSLAALGYTKPHTYEELRAVLSSGTVHFPKRLRQVAIFLWQHPSDVALGTIGQVAEQAGVQPSTLVRFAQIFGYRRLFRLPGAFQGSHQGLVAGRNGSRGAGAEAADTGANRPLSQRHGRRVAGLARPHRTTSSTSQLRARWSSTAGGGRPDLRHRQQARLSGHHLPLADTVAAGRAQRARRQCRLHRARPGRLHRQQATPCWRSRFSPYNSITPDLVAVARERKARIVTITDSTFSPLVKLSDTWLEVVESDFAGFRSLAASLAVGMALVHGVVARRAE